MKYLNADSMLMGSFVVVAVSCAVACVIGLIALVLCLASPSEWSTPERGCVAFGTQTVPVQIGKTTTMQTQSYCKEYSDALFIRRGDRVFKLVEVTP